MSPFSTLRPPLRPPLPPSIRPFIRHKSQSTSIPKKLQRVRDHSFDDLMEVEKKVRRTIKLIPLILSTPSNSLPISLLSSLARRHFHLSAQDSSFFLLRHPHVFHVFEHPVHRNLHCRLTPRALHQLQLESAALSSSLPAAAGRLRRVILLSAPHFRLRLEHIRLARADFGFPEDFEQSVVLSNPSLFRLVASNGQKFVEAVCKGGEDLPVAAVELAREREYRERGLNAEDARFAFPIHFPQRRL